MENPATWGLAEKVLREVLDENAEYYRQVAQGEAEPRYGPSLERRITDALRKEGLLREEPPPRAPWDPVPYLAAVIDGLERVIGGPYRHATDIYDLVGELAAGPYTALRGGLLLDEPGREGVSTEDALRELLAPVPDPAALDDDQLDVWFRWLDERTWQAVKENNRRAAAKLLGGQP